MRARCPRSGICRKAQGNPTRQRGTPGVGPIVLRPSLTRRVMIQTLAAFSETTEQQPVPCGDTNITFHAEGAASCAYGTQPKRLGHPALPAFGSQHFGAPGSSIFLKGGPISTRSLGTPSGHRPRASDHDPNSGNWCSGSKRTKKQVGNSVAPLRLRKSIIPPSFRMSSLRAPRVEDVETAFISAMTLIWFNSLIVVAEVSSSESLLCPEIP